LKLYFLQVQKKISFNRKPKILQISDYFVSLHRFMERYTIQKSHSKDGWICTDTQNKLICYFENGKFNDIKKLAFQHGVDRPDASTAERIYQGMYDWLKENHHDKVFSTKK